MCSIITLGIGFSRWKLNLIDIILLAVALGIDCLVASFSQGLIFNSDRIKNSLKLALVMGFFQGVMPIIGYTGAQGLYNYLFKYSNRIVFAIFLVLGLKFILEAFQEKKDKIQCLDIKCLIGLGIATSIDALVSGASIRLTHTNLVIAGVLIGIISFIMSLAGFWSGNLFRNLKSRYLEILGGMILIILAIRAL